jgi:hypothetical protein
VARPTSGSAGTLTVGTVPEESDASEAPVGEVESVVEHGSEVVVVVDERDVSEATEVVVDVGVEVDAALGQKVELVVELEVPEPPAPGADVPDDLAGCGACVTGGVVTGAVPVVPPPPVPVVPPPPPPPCRGGAVVVVVVVVGVVAHSASYSGAVRGGGSFGLPVPGSWKRQPSTSPWVTFPKAPVLE